MENLECGCITLKIFLSGCCCGADLLAPPAMCSWLFFVWVRHLSEFLSVSFRELHWQWSGAVALVMQPWAVTYANTGAFGLRRGVASPSWTRGECFHIVSSRGWKRFPTWASLLIPLLAPDMFALWSELLSVTWLHHLDLDQFMWSFLELPPQYSALSMAEEVAISDSWRGLRSLLGTS